MSEFIRKSKEEIHKMSVDEFCAYMKKWDKASIGQWSPRNMKEEEIPHFQTKEEAKKYLGGISFEEFEQRIMNQSNIKGKSHFSHNG